VKASAAKLSALKYNINHFNCYDYALQVFNSILDEKNCIPLQHVNFPFIAGRGGSPCGLYKTLTEIKDSGLEVPYSIQFGVQQSPVSTVIIN
jgi:hypothetical protein